MNVGASTPLVYHHAPKRVEVFYNNSRVLVLPGRSSRCCQRSTTSPMWWMSKTCAVRRNQNRINRRLKNWRIVNSVLGILYLFNQACEIPGGGEKCAKKGDRRSSKLLLEESYTDSNFRILVPTFVPPNNPENKSSPWTTSTTNRWKKLKQQKTAKLRSVRVRKEIQQLSLPIFSSPTSFCPAIAAFYRIKRGFPAVRTRDAINEIFHRM